MEKFTKKKLIERLIFDEEDTKLTMEGQRKFSSFLVENGKGFCVDGRAIWKELEVKDMFANWIKSNLENADAEKDKDYSVFFKPNAQFTNEEIINMTSQKRSAYGITEEYILTADIAKEIAMFAGASNRANNKLKANSKLVRKYFILMEKAVKEMMEWQSVREPEKMGYNLMKEIMVADYRKKHSFVTNNDIDSLMVRECVMIDTCLLGYSASALRDKMGYLDRETRSHLEVSKNKALSNIQEIIIGLVSAGLSFDERYKIIDSLCKSRYSDLRMDK